MSPDGATPKHFFTALTNFEEYQGLFKRTMNEGEEISPRGLLIVELRDAQITLDPHFPFQDFPHRNYKVDYFRKEMLWKLGADKYDDSIKQHAKMWESVQNPDGTFNSNYGQFWFGQQMGLIKAVHELMRDSDSRRACIPMLRDEHLAPGVRDTVCTESVTFHIRQGKLHMSVHMRSSDQIFGLGTDVPTFSVLLFLCLGMLRDFYPGLQAGKITVTAASSHIYERHFDMVNKIIDATPDFTKFTELPEPASAEECHTIVVNRGRMPMDGFERDPSVKMPLYDFIYAAS